LPAAILWLGISELFRAKRAMLAGLLKCLSFFLENAVQEWLALLAMPSATLPLLAS
jgi:hypothetical protein